MNSLLAWLAWPKSLDSFAKFYTILLFQLDHHQLKKIDRHHHRYSKHENVSKKKNENNGKMSFLRICQNLFFFQFNSKKQQKKNKTETVRKMKKNVLKQSNKDNRIWFDLILSVIFFRCNRDNSFHFITESTVISNNNLDHFSLIIWTFIFIFVFLDLQIIFQHLCICVCK